jgi:hypothetical protein
VPTGNTPWLLTLQTKLPAGRISYTNPGWARFLAAEIGGFFKENWLPVVNSVQLGTYGTGHFVYLLYYPGRDAYVQFMQNSLWPSLAPEIAMLTLHFVSHRTPVTYDIPASASETEPKDNGKLRFRRRVYLAHWAGLRSARTASAASGEDQMVVALSQIRPFRPDLLVSESRKGSLATQDTIMDSIMLLPVIERRKPPGRRPDRPVPGS